jgi:predicted nucleic acid-binding protein
LRCVFDTNILVSALLLPESKPRRALDLALRNGKVLPSFAVLAELYEVLSRKQFRRYVDEEDIRIFLAALTREAQWMWTYTYQLAATPRTIRSSNSL